MFLYNVVRDLRGLDWLQEGRRAYRGTPHQMSCSCGVSCRAVKWQVGKVWQVLREEIMIWLKKMMARKRSKARPLGVRENLCLH